MVKKKTWCYHGTCTNNHEKKTLLHVPKHCITMVHVLKKIIYYHGAHQKLWYNYMVNVKTSIVLSWVHAQKGKIWYYNGTFPKTLWYYHGESPKSLY